MISTAAGKSLALSDSQQVTRKTSNFVAHKLWLPKLIYDALPYFYFISGIAAFFATLYIGAWFWVLPHYILFSVACVHMGIMIYRRRHSRRADTSSPDPS